MLIRLLSPDSYKIDLEFVFEDISRVKIMMFGEVGGLKRAVDDLPGIWRLREVNQCLLAELEDGSDQVSRLRGLAALQVTVDDLNELAELLESDCVGIYLLQVLQQRWQVDVWLAGFHLRM